MPHLFPRSERGSHFGRSCLLALLASVLLFLASPGLFALPQLAWLALVPLFWSLGNQPPRRAALLGLICGLAYYLPLLYWIVIVLATYGQVPLPIAVLALFFLALYMSCYLAGFAFLCAKTRPRLSLLVFAPACWVALDLLRGFLFTGFPWLDLAYTQYNLPQLIQIADLTGHHGLTFLMILANGLIFTLITSLVQRKLPSNFTAGSSLSENVFADSAALSRPRTGETADASEAGRMSAENERKHSPTGTGYLPINPRCGWGEAPTSSPVLISAAALLLLAASGYSLWRMQTLPATLAQAEQLEVAAVQGNIPQDQKWQPAFQRGTIDTYLRLSNELYLNKKPQLIIWPETALPFYPYEHPLFLRLHSELILPRQAYLLTGVPHREKPSTTRTLTYTNSAFLLSPNGQVIGRYDKQHLVPFGEYIPFRRILGFASPLVETLGEFSPGQATPPLSCENSRIGVLICFESIFPEISRRQAEDGANLLVTITNDAWFGRSSAPWQHLAMGVFRAVETRKTLVRAANTGISAFIDPMGCIQGASPLFTEYARSQPVALLGGLTCYVRWGYLFPWGCLILTLAGIIIRRKARFFHF